MMGHPTRSHHGNHRRPPERTPRDRLNLSERDQASPRERAVLVAVLLPDTRADLSNPLGELDSLAESAGVCVVDSMIQKRNRLAANQALGSGKLRELVERVRAVDADTVIFDNDLSPRQIRALEKALERKVIDRSELILDIFAARAQTHEAQLQVELAQLQYTAPRLRGMWSHLERIAGAGGGTAAGAVGGVGTRGPGERQIEIDRRIVRDRISHLKREIEKIDARKTREVLGRRDVFTVSVVGYTNAGKTTLMNALTGSGQYVADQLFATLDTKTVRWNLGDGQAVLLSDTVGFVRDIPHHLVASFRATLEETIHAGLLLIVVDVSSSTAWQQLESVNEVLSNIGCRDIPRIVLLNKLDIANDTSVAEMLVCHCPQSLRISALTGEGLAELAGRVRDLLHERTADVAVLVPMAEGKLLSEIDRVADVQHRRYRAEGIELDIRVSRRRLDQLLGRYPALSVLRDRGHDKQPEREP